MFATVSRGTSHDDAQTTSNAVALRVLECSCIPSSIQWAVTPRKAFQSCLSGQKGGCAPCSLSPSHAQDIPAFETQTKNTILQRNNRYRDQPSRVTLIQPTGSSCVLRNATCSAANPMMCTRSSPLVGAMYRGSRSWTNSLEKNNEKGVSW